MIWSIAMTLLQQLVLLSWPDSMLPRGSQCIKSMKIPLVHCHRHHSRFFKQIALDVGPNDMPLLEVYTHEFSKSTWVFIAHSFTISECLKDGVGSQYFLFNRVTFTRPQYCQQLNTVFRWFSLACSTFSRNDDCLLFLLGLKSLEGFPCKVKHMRLSLPCLPC